MGHDMLRRTCTPLLGWLAGAGLQLQQAALWPTAVYVAALAAGVLALVAARRWATTSALLLAAIGAAAVGMGVTGWHAAARLADALPAALEGADVQATGVIASLPEASSAGIRFAFDVESARSGGVAVTVPQRLALGWYAGRHDDAALSQPQRTLAAGQRWTFTVRLRRPHGTSNPNGFDYELALFEQRVRATGYVRDAPAPRFVETTGAHPVERLRQHVRNAIAAAVADRRVAGVLAALSVGDQSAIDRDDWDVFRATGVAHLVSISGVHVTMFAWLAALVIGAAWRRSMRAMLWLPAVQAGRIGGVAAAAGYAVFSGWGVPSQRTVWMLAVVAALQIGGRRWPWPLVLLAAAAAVTAVDPWALLQPGFWLSFTAVGLLMASDPAHVATRPQASAEAPVAQPRWRRAIGGLGRHLGGEFRAQVIATIGLTPLTLVFFQQISVVGFAANVVAIPLVTLVVTPLALLGAVFAPLWLVAAWVVQGLTGWLALLASWPGAVWRVPAAPLWAQLAGLAGAVLMMLPLPWRLRLGGLPLIVPLMLPPLDEPAAGAFDALAADVGQGSAVLIRTQHHLLVYDSGPQYGAQSDAGERVLLPLLRSLGLTRIDRLVLSHRDLDHTGGALSLLHGMPVGDVLSSLEATHPLLAAAPAPQRCLAGQRWDWDGVRFEVLQPVPGAYGTTAGATGGRVRSNALSCVVRVWSEASGSVLLAGDIERDQEAALVAGLGDGLHSDVLLVPHHGSHTSSTAGFIAAVAPAVAVVQSGYRNRFGHPAPEVLARYALADIPVVASPACGAWLWHQRTGVCWRTLRRRYWQPLAPEPASGVVVATVAESAATGATTAAATPAKIAAGDPPNGLDFANYPAGEWHATELR